MEIYGVPTNRCCAPLNVEKHKTLLTFRQIVPCAHYYNCVKCNKTGNFVRINVTFRRVRIIIAAMAKQ